MPPVVTNALEGCLSSAQSERKRESRLMRITLKQLQILAAVVSQGSLSRASKVLHRSQPAISHQINQLEATCGFALLERTTRGVKATVAGQELVRTAHAVERELNALEGRIVAFEKRH